MQHYLKLSQETLYLAISLLDTILDKRDIEADKLQLVGIVIAFISDSGFFNVDPPPPLPSHLTSLSSLFNKGGGGAPRGGGIGCDRFE